MDLDLVDAFVADGVTTLVAGDDDQSIYSFRYASPVGIQTFTSRHVNASDHQLIHCFRCTPGVLDPARALLTPFSAPGRLPKTQTSMYATSMPPVAGHALLWRFGNGNAESAAVAASCAELVAAGVAPGDIMILLSNQRVLGHGLYDALEAASVPFVRSREEPYCDTTAGRAALSVVRITSEPRDLVAHRDLLGLRPGIGPGRCLQITTRAINANIRATDLFYGFIPQGTLTPTQLAAVTGVRDIAQVVDPWDLDDLLGARRVALADLIEEATDAAERADWESYVADLPDDMTLSELRDVLYAQWVCSPVLAPPERFVLT